MASSICPKKFFERYELVQKIGSGSFSEVISCKHKETGKMYACKQLNRRFKCWEKVQEISEVKTLMKIPEHENLVKMVELHYDADFEQVSIVLDLMDTDLCQLIKERQKLFRVSQLQSMMRMILQGLNYLHKNGLIHRDIKPENVLIKYASDGYLLALGDFGSIKGKHATPPFTRYISTRWYRSPELLLSLGMYGFEIDIWALGCVFYEALKLTPLFDGATEQIQIHKIQEALGPVPKKLIKKFRKVLPKPNDEDTVESQTRRSNIEAFLNGRSTPYLSPYPQTLGERMRDTNLVTRNFLQRMLEYDPNRRATTAELLEHDFLNPWKTDVKATVARKLRNLLADANVVSPQIVGNPIPSFRMLDENVESGVYILTRMEDAPSDGSIPDSANAASDDLAMQNVSKPTAIPSGSTSVRVRRAATPGILKLATETKTPGCVKHTPGKTVTFPDDEHLTARVSGTKWWNVASPTLPDEIPPYQFIVDSQDNTKDRLTDGNEINRNNPPEQLYTESYDPTLNSSDNLPRTSNENFETTSPEREPGLLKPKIGQTQTRPQGDIPAERSLEVLPQVNIPAERSLEVLFRNSQLGPLPGYRSKEFQSQPRQESQFSDDEDETSRRTIFDEDFDEITQTPPFQILQSVIQRANIPEICVWPPTDEQPETAVTSNPDENENMNLDPNETNNAGRLNVDLSSTRNENEPLSDPVLNVIINTKPANGTFGRRQMMLDSPAGSSASLIPVRVNRDHNGNNRTAVRPRNHRRDQNLANFTDPKTGRELTGVERTFSRDNSIGTISYIWPTRDESPPEE